MRLRLGRLAPFAAVRDLGLDRTPVCPARHGEERLADLELHGGRRVAVRERLLVDAAERTRPRLCPAPPAWS